MRRRDFLSLLGGAALSPVAARAQPAVPPGERWLRHLNDDLLPFWTMPAALGETPGAFPSVRCDDGTLYDKRKPCAEVARQLREAQPKPELSPRYRHVVALARQAYGYGVAFHLTGRREFLDAMSAGIDFIRRSALDRTNGGMATRQRIADGAWGPPPAERNPQELAYGLLGMAFYYYLTRDADIERDILAVKDFIFATYGTAQDVLSWPHAARTSNDAATYRLVAQLDQMNSYLVLLAPLFAEPARSAWKESLVRLAQEMIARFYSSRERLFFLMADRPADTALATAGTDFGHNAKALWMIRFAGSMAARPDLVAFAEENAKELLARAYLEDCGCWADGLLPGGALRRHKTWWIYAELDQLAGTLALKDAAYARYLPRAYDYWFRHFVDNEAGEVWHTLDGDTHAPLRDLPKQWAWKNAYHSFEHALVGYIVAQRLNGQRATLHYAFAGETLPENVQPYYFTGAIRTVDGERGESARRVQRIGFDITG